MAKDFTKRRDEKVPSIDGIPTFFWHLVNKYVKDAWQVDGEEVILYEEFSVLRKHKAEEIILHLMEESFREGIQQSIYIRKQQSGAL